MSRTSFVQDESGGIALYLSAAVTDGWSAGSIIRATGAVGDRYGQRTLRANIASVELIACGTDLPAVLAMATGLPGEAEEGRRMALSGTVVEAPTSLSDGTGILIDDGSGPIRVIASAAALGGETPVRGSLVRAAGPLGQRDSTGQGTYGYRVFATLPGEATVEPPPTPTPTPIPDPTASPDPGLDPTPTPGLSSAPGSSDDPSGGSPFAPDGPSLIPISTARTYAIGSRVRVAGTVIAEPGRLGAASLVAIQDDGAGIAVRLPAGFGVERGARLEVTGVLAQPYGQLEIKVDRGRISVTPQAAVAQPIAIGSAGLDESVEGRLVTVVGRLEATLAKSGTGDLSMTITSDAGERVRVVADSTSDLQPADFRKGGRYRLSGSWASTQAGSVAWMGTGSGSVTLTTSSASTRHPRVRPDPTRRRPTEVLRTGPRAGRGFCPPGRARAPVPRDGGSLTPVAQAAITRDQAVRIAGIYCRPPSA